MPAFFDGHNDTLLRLHLADSDVEPFFSGRRGHLDLPKARAGGFGGGFFAVFVPNPSDEDLLDLVDDKGSKGAVGKPAKLPWSRDNAPYSPPVDAETAVRIATEVMDLAERLVSVGKGRIVWMKDSSDLDQAERAFRSMPHDIDAVRLVLHFEGAEPIRSDLSNLEHWYSRGLRSLGLVWSRRNDFAAGVPFRYPSTPDHFDGLTAAGKDLVRACDELGILLDLAHLNERGFWDVSRTSTKPLVVTHAGALSVCPSSRNLTDDQIRAIGDSDGVVGVNLHCGDLRTDGRLNSDTPLEVVIQHIETMVGLAGPRHVALGSDFDGALMPRCLSDASKLPTLLSGLKDRGWKDDALAAFAYGNWLRALRAAWEG